MTTTRRATASLATLALATASCTASGASAGAHRDVRAPKVAVTVNHMLTPRSR